MLYRSLLPDCHSCFRLEQEGMAGRWAVEGLIFILFGFAPVFLVRMFYRSRRS